MSLLELVWLVFVFNVLTFGNGPAMVPLLQNSLVDQSGVLTLEQLLYAFAIARITPGQANVYVASIGYFLYGWVGAILATLAVQLPGYLILPLLRGFEKLQSAAWVRNATRGLVTASIGLIFSATLSISQRTLTGAVSWVVFVAMFVLIYFLRWNIVTSLLLVSAVGVVLRLFGMI